MIVILDYKIGNVGSIKNMLHKVGAESIISNDLGTIEKASKLILPGVGAFGRGMEKLKESNFYDLLNEKVLQHKTPILGICLGMQLLGKGSQEGDAEGLGWIDATCEKFDFSNSPENIYLKIPHMGWNVTKIKNHTGIFKNWEGDPRFYYVHSYHMVCENEADIAATSDYGVEFTSFVQKGHIYGAQFHPEKSHKFGMHLMRNFAELDNA